MSSAQSSLSDMVGVLTARDAGLGEMLNSLLSGTDAFGCTLWRGVPPSAPVRAGTSQLLFCAAQFLPNEQNHLCHNIDIESGPAKDALRTGKPVILSGATTRAYLARVRPSLAAAGVQEMITIPLVFQDSAPGVLDVYAVTTGALPREQVEDLAHAASIIPILYPMIRDRDRYKLLQGLNEKITLAELEAGDAPLHKDEISRLATDVCTDVARTIHCSEVSIFLEDRVEAASEYHCIGTTWNKHIRKDSYLASHEDGLTGWVLEHGEPLAIYDLLGFEAEKQKLATTHPGLVWYDPFDIAKVARGVLNLSHSDPLPPLSFIAVPLLDRATVIGALRCSVGIQGPFYFGDRELDLLKVVSTQLTQYLSNWMHRRELQFDNSAWQSVVSTMGRLNHFVQQEMLANPDEGRLLNETLLTARKTLSSLRLHRVAFVPAGSSSNGPAPELVSVGEVPWPQGDSIPTKGTVIEAPIIVAERDVGLLSVTPADAKIRPYAQAGCELLAQQLGLYLELIRSIADLRVTEVRLQEQVHQVTRLQGEQADIFEDLEHQLVSPVLTLQKRLRAVVSSVLPPDLRREITPLLGLSRKTGRVTRSMGVFARLTRGESLPLHLQIRSRDDIARLLVEAAQDHELLLPPERNVQFSVDRTAGAFARRDWYFSLDSGLLEQAINNVFDNAGKYSHDDTVVDIGADFSAVGDLIIRVSSTGLTVHPTQVDLCKQRRWRGEDAEAVTGEGSGIGLWIVDNVLRSHGGLLEIRTGNKLGSRFEVRLMFPVSVSDGVLGIAAAGAQRRVG